jgi:hypothetical protein
MQKPRVLIPTTVLAGLALVGLLLAGPASMPLIAETPPAAASHDIYNPARTALVNAQRQLAESIHQQQEILEQTKHIHGQLNSSLELLASAAALDPSMKAPINAVRQRLASLQDDPALCSMKNGSSLADASTLLDELQLLIDHY